MGTEIKKGDRVVVREYTGTATYVGAGYVEVKPDGFDKCDHVCAPVTQVEKAPQPVPAPGTIIEFEDTKARFQVVDDKGNLLKLYSGGGTATGYTWNYQSKDGTRPFKVATFA